MHSSTGIWRKFVVATWYRVLGIKGQLVACCRGCYFKAKISSTPCVRTALILRPDHAIRMTNRLQISVVVFPAGEASLSPPPAGGCLRKANKPLTRCYGSSTWYVRTYIRTAKYRVTTAARKSQTREYVLPLECVVSEQPSPVPRVPC